MSFSALSGDINLIRKIPRRGGFSSLTPPVTSTVGVYPGRFYNKFLLHLRKISIRSNILTAFFKVIDSQLKPFTQVCIDQMVCTLFGRISFSLAMLILSFKVTPVKDSTFSFRSIRRAA